MKTYATPRRTIRGICISFLTGVLVFNAHSSPNDAGLSPAEASEQIPWSEIGARAGADYKGKGLSVSPADNGALLRCVFQRLDGEATTEGLWLTSTVPDVVNDHFRVVASAIGRTADRNAIVSQGSAASTTAQTSPRWVFGDSRILLAATGTVSVDGKTVRFSRPGLIEEYMVSMDGMRQDFILLDRPTGKGQLRLEMDVNGARAEQTAYGARLVLENSGRKIAYSRLHVTDATGRVLDARIDVSSINRIAVLVNDVEAIYPVRIDPTFSDENWISMGGIPGASFDVYAAVVDGSGNLYIGGAFTLVGETMADRIAKWNGRTWSALGSGMNGAVRALAWAGSELYAGGDFTVAGGHAANHVAKWNGSSWAALGSGMNNEVHALAISGTVLYAGGYFTTAGGNAANRIAKWDGGSWSALGLGTDDGVLTLAVSGSDSDVYAGGVFTRAGGIVAIFIAKWNGSSWSALGSGMNGSVRALALSGSELYAGGGFTRAGGNAANYIAKWNGSSWSALGSGMNGSVRALARSGADVYAGGGFTTVGGGAANYVARWNGNSWSALDSGISDGIVSALAVSGSDVYAGGYFRRAGGTAANHVAKWDGSSWSALGSGMNDRVSALAMSGTDLYVAGLFTTAGGNTANYIARWNGNDWSALGSGMNDIVLALAVSGTDLYAGGSFTTADGTGANRIAKWNGSSWSALGSGMDRSALKLAVSGSDLYVGGRFTMAGGAVANQIAKWNGSSWSALGAGLSGGFDETGVYALAVAGGDLYVGGNFSAAGGLAATNIAKWNGSSWSALGAGMDSSVFALAVLGNDLYAGGAFARAGGNTANGIAKWDGSIWSALGLGVGGEFPYVYAIARLDSDLYAGGHFTTAGGNSANYIAKWNGGTWSALGSGLNDYVATLAVSDHNLYVGGPFTTAGGKVSAYLARAGIAATTNCAAEITSDNNLFPACGGSNTVTLAIGTGCNWTTSGGCGFASVTPSNGTGPAVVTITVEPNPTIRNRSCTLRIADQEFGIVQERGNGCAGNVLEVTIATNQFTAAPGHFKLIAPTNTIDLSASVRGNASPAFQWCRESTNENGSLVYDDVVFTSPQSSNTTVIFEYAGTYNLSVTATDGIRSGSLSVTVTVELNPNAIFQNIGNFLNASKPDGTVNTNKFFTRFPSTLADATNYYAAIDPQWRKTNFASWKEANDFPPGPIPAVINGEIISATYFNALDLGFGRRMIMRKNGNEWAFAVRNYKTADDAANDSGLIATVAMEYSRGVNGIPFTKFYVFSNDISETRAPSADLDGGGQKFVPGLCVVCHGGTTGTVNPGDSGNLHAHFLPFDLRAFDYSCRNGLTRADQEPVFKALNLAVLDIEQRIPMEHNATNGRPAITNLIHGWYGPGLTNATQDDYFVPAGWQDSTMSGILSTGRQAYLYQSVVAPSCRACHVTRGTSFGLPSDFSSFASFYHFSAVGPNSLMKIEVFGTNDISAPIVSMSTNVSTSAYALGLMPQARRTFERFWNSVSPRPQPEILRDYLLGRLNTYASPPATNLVIEPIGNDVQISFTTAAGGSYRLEQSEQVPFVPSAPIHGALSGTGGTNRIIQPIEAAHPKRFFRVRSLP